jgi:hypothetical protein
MLSRIDEGKGDMDGKGFDELTRRLAMQRSRRSVLRGIVGGSAALVATRAGAGLAAPEGKAEICHLGDDGLFHLISVAQSALPAHEAHGDGYLGSDGHCSACGDSCSGYETCGGGVAAGQCGCTPTFTSESCDGDICGEFEDGCGSYVTCGCDEGYVCGENGCEPVIVRNPAIYISFDPTGDSRFCLPQVDLVDFAPNTEYPLTVEISYFSDLTTNETYSAPRTTDNDGNWSGYPIGSYREAAAGINWIRAISNGITTDWYDIEC